MRRWGAVVTPFAASDGDDPAMSGGGPYFLWQYEPSMRFAGRCRVARRNRFREVSRRGQPRLVRKRRRNRVVSKPETNLSLTCHCRRPATRESVHYATFDDTVGCENSLEARAQAARLHSAPPACYRAGAFLGCWMEKGLP